MLEHDRISLVECLRQAADSWTKATGRTLGSLSARVINHGSFFDRIEHRSAGANTSTLEKFAVFLGDVTNWPDEKVPSEVLGFVQRVEGGGVIHGALIAAAQHAPSTGQSDEKSSGVSA